MYFIGKVAKKVSWEIEFYLKKKEYSTMHSSWMAFLVKAR